MPLPRKVSTILRSTNRTVSTRPVWSGPESKNSNGGITFSLLSRFLTCRERFRVRVIEGLKPVDDFNHRMFYGNLWHVCEEMHAGSNPQDWATALKEYAQKEVQRYPLHADQIDKWYNVCKVQFPIYVDYWSMNPDIANRMPLLSEQVFDVPYLLPSGRTVRLRGRWDSVDLVRSGKSSGIWLMENKTKGDIDPEKMQRQLSFDLQTQIYLVALKAYNATGDLAKSPIRGVRYNVIRRPLSGGRGTIKQLQPTKTRPQGESKAEYYERVAQYIREVPNTYFMRWNVTVTEGDIYNFQTKCLDPLLENLCDWWEHVSSEYGRDQETLFRTSLHWQHPFGVRNIIDEGGHTDLDSYLQTGSTLGLVRDEVLFRELQE